MSVHVEAPTPGKSRSVPLGRWSYSISANAVSEQSECTTQVWRRLVRVASSLWSLRKLAVFPEQLALPVHHAFSFEDFLRIGSVIYLN